MNLYCQFYQLYELRHKTLPCITAIMPKSTKVTWSQRNMWTEYFICPVMFYNRHSHHSNLVFSSNRIISVKLDATLSLAAAVSLYSTHKIALRYSTFKTFNEKVSLLAKLSEERSLWTAQRRDLYAKVWLNYEGCFDVCVN